MKGLWKRTIKIITVTILLASFAACNKKEPGLPSVEERDQSIADGKITEEETKEKTDEEKLDEKMVVELDKKEEDAKGMDGNQSNLTVFASHQYPAKEKYEYGYLGLSYVLPKKLNELINNGTIVVYCDFSMVKDVVIEYASIGLYHFSKDTKWTNLDELKAISKQVSRKEKPGAISIFSINYLKDHSVEELTGCEENKELGKSSDGNYVFYLSTNSAAIEAELLKSAEITISDPVPIPNKSVFSFDIMSESRENVSNIGDFKAQNANLEEVTPSIFEDYELTMINVWATFCSPCIEEMPDLEEIRAEMQKDGVKFNIVGICMDVGEDGVIDNRSLATVRTIIEKTGIKYETLFPDDVLNQGRMKGIQIYPETFFANKDGNIVGETYIGTRAKEEWIKIINSELSKLKK